MIHEWVTVDNSWNDTDVRKPKYGEENVPLLLYPQQIPRGLVGDWTWTPAVRGWQLNNLPWHCAASNRHPSIVYSHLHTYIEYFSISLKVIDLFRWHKVGNKMKINQRMLSKIFHEIRPYKYPFSHAISVFNKTCSVTHGVFSAEIM